MKNKRIYMIVLIILAALFRIWEVTKPKEAYAKAYYDAGFDYHQSQQFKKAVKNFQKSIQHNPYNHYAHAFLGLSLLESGDDQYPSALKEFYLARKWNSSNSIALFHIGRDYQKRGDYHQAILYMEMALTTSLDVPEYLEGVGEAYHLAGIDWKAEEKLKKLRILKQDQLADRLEAFMRQNQH